MKHTHSILKKTAAIIFSFSLILLTNSCKKESLGSFTPQKKVDKIYVKAGSNNVLKEEWTWNNGLLQKIDHFASNGKIIDYSEEFKYNGSKIIEVSAEDEKLDYFYDGENLVRIEYLVKNIYKETYELIYAKDVINKILIKVENPEGKPENCRLSPLGDESLNILFQGISAKESSKGVQEGEIKISWNDGNVVRADVVRKSLSTTSSDPTITYNYVYDKQKTPFGNLLSFNIDNIFDRNPINGGFSKNNILSVYRTIFNDDLNSYQTESWAYAYEYKNKYPISIKETHIDYRGRETKGEEYVISYY